MTDIGIIAVIVLVYTAIQLRGIRRAIETFNAVHDVKALAEFARRH